LPQSSSNRLLTEKDRPSPPARRYGDKQQFHHRSGGLSSDWLSAGGPFIGMAES
jgi:hypothetical protein